MSTRRIQLELCAVAKDYRPAYPASLSPEQYRELLADALGARIRRLASAAALVLAAPGGAAQRPDGSREERLLALIREMHREDPSSWYPRSRFAPQGALDGCGEPTIVPHIPIMFGNSMNGIFDTGRAQQLALRVFEIYGLAPESRVAIEAGAGNAEIDGLDTAAKIGFELRRGVRKPADPDASAAPRHGEVRDPEFLEASELAALNAAGYRVHVADAEHFPVMDGDKFTPRLAYLAGIVDFLNSVTDGPDIDLSAILFKRVQGFPVPDVRRLPLPPGTEVKGEFGYRSLTLETAATLRFEFGGPDAPPGGVENEKWTKRRWTPLESAFPTLGVPTVVAFERFYCSDMTKVRCKLLQAGADGAPALALEASLPTFFTPAAFDATRPFTLELTLPAGKATLSDRLVVGVSAR